MIAAEILIPPRSPDAPAVTQTAGRAVEGATFADILAQRLGAGVTDVAAGDGQPVASDPAGADAASETASTLPGMVVAGATVMATETLPASANLVANLSLTATAAPSTPSGAAPTAPDLPAEVPGATQPVVTTDLPELAEPTPTAATVAQTSATPDTAAPDTATLGETASPAAPADAPAAETPIAPAPATAETETPPDATAPGTEPPPQPDTTDATADESSDAPDDGQTDDAPQTDQAAEAAPQAQPATLPPLLSLIQPLIAPQSGPAGDGPDTVGQSEITGSTPRQRGMSGRLATLTDAPAQAKDDGPSFTDRLAAATDRAQDRPPVQNDGTQPMVPRHETQTDAAAETDTLITTAQPLPPDSRATTPVPAAPQRVPDTAPLDTTQSGWEAALTERITTRATELGQEIEITLTPDNLGTVRIKLDLSDKAATVQIVTDTPQAAQLFQQSEARLAEALNRAGLSLTSHDASSRDAGGRDGGQRQGQGPANPRAEAALSGLRGALSAPVQTGRATNLVNIVA